MATKKKVVKPAAKKTAKPVKPAPKKVVKKPAPAKKAPKPAPKKAVKSAAKKPVKPVKPVKAAKPAPKKVVPAKKVPNPVSKKPVIVKKPVQKPMAKKVEVKKPEVKAAPVKVAEPIKSTASLKAKDIKVAPPRPVVIPKINTKTSRKYQPDFTKSVLDQIVHDPGAPIVRYSDNDDARYMTMEDGSMSMEREQLSQMASRQITFIDHLEKALMRIENKTYGICRVTGKLIDKARLRAVPHATLSIEAKMSGNK